ncbi:30S ribosomal protein S9 [Patescibacteria group bacterium]|nr:30S ribosomal protein S9 [Patescibacteria group bacterium]
MVEGKKTIEEVTEITEATEEKEFNFDDLKTDRYFEAIGKRKTAVANVRLYTQGDKTILVNDKDYKEYFPDLELQQIIESALEKMNAVGKFKISVKLNGGGFHAQAEAVRHGISRALVKLNPEFRKKLRRIGYLTRDPRKRERKKFGLKRARKAPQWAKR